MTYSFHSSMSAGVFAPRAMNTWRMIGSTSRAGRPEYARCRPARRASRASVCPSSADDRFEPLLARTGARRRRAAGTPCRRRIRRRRAARSRASAALAAKELVRHLRQNAGAVAGQRIAAAGAAVGQIDQDLQARADDLVALLAAHVDDEADAAGVVLVRGIVEALRGRADRACFGSCCMACCYRIRTRRFAALQRLLEPLRSAARPLPLPPGHGETRRRRVGVLCH